ncbi:MAG: hypothetical protein A2Z49_05585 [Chloroflexi bacterium RBG_19FT_COMBO_56_12]|nr:MAG: hypothetical protein A2W36_01140 [Chloroflexi bacterium RBG_16_58_14]OGO72462.1 MAG: hypothetical protein A2Z49_05585 [Chloroflexi bacterium RBG_19FT_COMBO_56_12]
MVTEKRFALFIATSEYKGSKFKSLPSSVNDVERLGRVLKDPNIDGFMSVKTVANRPTNTVCKAISQFIEDKKQSDVLLVYYSGHGVLDSDGSLCLPLRDTEKRYLSATALEAEFITREMDKKDWDVWC